MKQIALVLFLVAGMRLTVSGQSAMIQGRVLDSSSQAVVEGVDVLLLHAQNHKPLYQTRTGNKGFVFRQVPGGSYGLVVVAMGFVNDTLQVFVKGGDTLRLTIALRPSPNELGDVVVKSAPRPVTLKGDTLSFNAAAYALRQDARFEDLLRLLPGAEVDREGNITFQGRRVDKIMINGQDFFLGGTKSANSLPAEIIATVEAFGTQSDAAKFSGVKENNETHTLNIKTKKGMEELWMGSVYGSKGEEQNYAAGGTLTKLGKALMLTANLGTNNINNRFTGVESKNTAPQTGIQSVSNMDINLMRKWGSKVIANLTFIGNQQQTEALESSGRRLFLGDSSLQEQRVGQRLVRDKKYPVNLKLTYNANERNQWVFLSGVTATHNYNSTEDTAIVQTLQNSGAAYTSSRAQTRNTGEQRALSVNNQLDWRHRFSKVGRTLQWSLNQSVQSGKNTGGLFSLLNSYTPSGNLQRQVQNNQQYRQNSSGHQYGTTVTYTEPLFTQHHLLFTYAFNTQLQKNDKATYNYDSTMGGYTLPDALTSNAFENRNITHRIEGGFGRNSPKINYRVGLGWQYRLLDNLSISPHRHIRQSFANLFPRVNVNLVLRKGQSLIVSYIGSGKAPAIEQLQPLPDLSNPLFIKSGNPDLKQSFHHVAFLRYQTVNSKSFNSLSVNATGNITRNQIVSSIVLLPGGVQQQQFVNVNGNYNLSTNAVYSFGFAGKDGKRNSASIQTHLMHGKEVSLMNGQQNTTGSFSWTQNVQMGYHIGTRFMANVSAGARLAFYRYSLSPQQNTRSWDCNSILDLSCELPLGITIQGSYAWMYLGTSGVLPSQASHLVNAAIYKRLFTNRKWQLRLSAFDLLNANRNFTQSTGPNYIYTQQTNQLQRMFLVSLIYDFKILHRADAR